jgi:peptide/nickel transport system substrate-binding protein
MTVLLAGASVLFLIMNIGYADTPKKGGDLKAAIFQYPRHFNPAIQSGAATMGPGAALFATLLEFDENWQAVPYLAKSWKVSDDNLTFTFKLVDNATFHDGKPVTSEDVAFSLGTVKKNHPFGIAMFGAVDRVETPNPQTAVFKLNKPNPVLLLSLSTVLMPVIPKHVYGTEAIQTHPANLKPIGSGPFRFVEAKPGEYFIFERYDKYFRTGLPHFNRIIYTLVKDASAAEIAFKRGDFHISSSAGMRLQNIARLKTFDHLSVIQRRDAIGPIMFLEFNLRKAPFTNLKVRQAIAHAIDKEFITQKLHQGLSVVATGPIPHPSPFYTSDVHKYPLDISKANKLLDEAGYPPKAGGIRFSSGLDWYPGDIDNQQVVAEYLKPQLRKIGIDIQLRPPADFPGWAKRMASWEHELSMNGIFMWGDPVIGIHRVYLCDNIKNMVWTNTQGYCNPKADEAMKKAGMEMNPDKRKALYSEFQKIVTEDLPLVWTHELPYFSIIHKDLRDVPSGIWSLVAPFDKTYWKDGKEPK